MLGGITEVRFSMFDNGTPEPDMVALISGRVDDAMLGMLPQSSTKYRRIDANTILFGNGHSIEKGRCAHAAGDARYCGRVCFRGRRR